MQQTLILGSTSPFRRELLGKIGLNFETDSPDVDEAQHLNESPSELVIRLAEAKARAVAERHPDALIIGSDQVACIDNEILGKPGNRINAIKQLSIAAGKVVTFYTGLCLYNARSQQANSICELFKVHFRDLSQEQIERYVDAETPYNCAGSFKSEGLGISLFNRLEGDDPNALIGLPLIRLISMLDKEGVAIP